MPLLNQHVNSRQWWYYSVNVTKSGGGMLIVINQTNLGGDVDLYVQSGGFPSQTHYTSKEVISSCADLMSCQVSTSSNFALSIANPSAGMWYIGVFGFLATDYVITVTLTGTECPTLNNCNPPHGTCVDAGVCQCNSGWTGAACSIRIHCHLDPH